MRIIKNTLLAFAVSMTAIFNLASAQNQEVLFNTTSCGQETIEITYTSDVPKYIFFEIIGENLLGVGSYGRVSNVSNQDGTCTATYDVSALMTCGAGENFSKAYNTCHKIKVYEGNLNDSSNYDESTKLLFAKNTTDFIHNNSNK
jgi:hypothetical protein